MTRQFSKQGWPIKLTWLGATSWERKKQGSGLLEVRVVCYLIIKSNEMGQQRSGVDLKESRTNWWWRKPFARPKLWLRWQISIWIISFLSPDIYRLCPWRPSRKWYFFFFFIEKKYKILIFSNKWSYLRKIVIRLRTNPQCFNFLGHYIYYINWRKCFSWNQLG